MRVSGRLLALVLFAVVGLLSLALTGLLDWITSILFLALELLAEFLRPYLWKRSAHGRGHHARGRLPVAATGRHRRLAHRKASFKHHPSGFPEGVADSLEPRSRLLLPLSADHPELVEYALRECRQRQAELLLLFLRPLALVPMGPNAIPRPEEDEAARDLFARVSGEAREAGVPLRTRYQVSRSLSATILEVARAEEADILVMEPSRRNFVWRALIGDPTDSVMRHLPEHANLLIHAS